MFEPFWGSWENWTSSVNEKCRKNTAKIFSADFAEKSTLSPVPSLILIWCSGVHLYYYLWVVWMKSKLVKQFQEKIKVDFVQFIEMAVQCLLLGRGFINERLDTSDHHRYISMHLKYKNVISSANFELTLGKRPSALMAVPTPHLLAWYRSILVLLKRAIGLSPEEEVILSTLSKRLNISLYDSVFLRILAQFFSLPSFLFLDFSEFSVFTNLKAFNPLPAWAS